MAPRVCPLELVIVMEVQLQQITARECIAGVVFRLHFRNVHPVLVHPHLLDEQITALVLSVEHHLHRDAAGRPVQGGHGSHLHGHQITHERTVHEIGQQHPAFMLVHTQNRGFLLQFNQVGLFGPGPGGVAPAPDGTADRLQGFILPGPIDIQAGRDILGFGVHAFPAFRVYIHHRQSRIYRQADMLLLGADLKKEGRHIRDLAGLGILERNHQANLGTVHLFHLVVL